MEKKVNENTKLKIEVEELKKKIRLLARTKIKLFVMGIRKLIG